VCASAVAVNVRRQRSPESEGWQLQWHGFQGKRPLTSLSVAVMTGMDGEEGWLRDGIANCIKGMLISFGRVRHGGISGTTCELNL